MLKESDLAFERYLQLQPDSVADPYPFYEPMRAEGSVRWSEGIGGWVITGYAETEAPLRQAHVSSNRHAVGAHIAVCFRAGASARRARAPLVDVGQLRAHDHTRMRSLVNKAFTPRAVEAMRARIQTLAVMLPTADIARRITADLGTQVMAEACSHVYNNMEHTLEQRTVTPVQCPFACSPYTSRDGSMRSL